MAAPASISSPIPPSIGTIGAGGGGGPPDGCIKTSKYTVIPTALTVVREINISSSFFFKWL
jgi:hypothetical protein